MDPRQWLPLVARMVEKPSEMEWRLAVIQAYLPLYHVSNIWLTRCGFRVPSPAHAHAYMRLRWRNCGVPALAEVGVALGELHTLRRRFDNNPDAKITQALARRVLATAASNVSVLDDLMADESMRHQVTEEMRRYERDELGEETWQAEAERE